MKYIIEEKTIQTKALKNKLPQAGVKPAAVSMGLLWMNLILSYKLWKLSLIIKSIYTLLESESMDLCMPWYLPLVSRKLPEKITFFPQVEDGNNDGVPCKDQFLLLSLQNSNISYLSSGRHDRPQNSVSSVKILEVGFHEADRNRKCGF